MIRQAIFFVCCTFCFQLLAQTNLSNEVISIPGVQRFELKTEIPQLHTSEGFLRSNTITFNFGQYGDIDLELFFADIIGEDYLIASSSGQERPVQVKTYMGFSPDGGHVRLTQAEDFLYGFVEFQEEVFWIEPAWYYSEDHEKSSAVVIYRSQDVPFDEEKSCGNHETDMRVNSLLQHVENRNERLNECYKVKIAIASDYSMFTKYNNSVADVELHNIAVINNVNGNYTGAFDDDIEFEIVEQFVSNCSSCDPWSSTTNPFTLLDDFTLWGQGGGFSSVYGLGELWTNRDFDGATVGLAWINTLCTSYEYHILQDYTSNANSLRTMTAHEIGHNFGYGHDTTNFVHIMAPFVNGSNTWSTASSTTISNTIVSRTSYSNCLSACTSAQAPGAAFIASSTLVCGTNTIQFTDQSTNSPTSWSWVFENGTPATSTQSNPVVEYSTNGSHRVTLTVTNSAGSDTEQKNNFITIDDVPNANFTFLRTGNSVDFNKTNSAGNCSWNFGDGTTSSACNPTHVYSQDMTFSVSLVSSNACGSETETILLETDNCPNVVTLDGVIQTDAYTAGSVIQCAGTILSNSEVSLHAPNSISLEAGFEIRSGAVFNATPSGCVN